MFAAPDKSLELSASEPSCRTLKCTIPAAVANTTAVDDLVLLARLVLSLARCSARICLNRRAKGSNGELP